MDVAGGVSAPAAPSTEAPVHRVLDAVAITTLMARVQSRAMSLNSPARRLALPLLVLGCLAVPATASANTTADLSVTAPHLDGDEQPTVGAVANYSFYVSNNGPDEAEATAVVTLGDAEQLVAVDAGQGACTQTAPIVCSFGTMLPGGSVMVTAQVRFTKVSASNTHQVKVSGAAGNTDPDESNNQAAVVTRVVTSTGSESDTPEVATGTWSRTQSRLKVDAAVTPYGTGKVYFEYGKTTRYGSKTEAQKVSGSRGKTVKFVLARLKMDTVYHYRAVLVVDGKTYRGKDVKARTLGKLMYGPLTLKAVKRRPTSVDYVGRLGAGLADAPGACQGKVVVLVYTLQGADLLNKSTRLKRDCTYKITVPFGRAQASRYGKRGAVLTQARFQGNKAVSPVGSESDRP